MNVVFCRPTAFQAAVYKREVDILLNKVRVYKVYQVCWGRISSCEEGKEIIYHGCVEKYNVEKTESNIIFPFVLRLLRRISSREEGKGTENKDFKKWGWGRLSSCMELYTLLNQVESEPGTHLSAISSLKTICNSPYLKDPNLAGTGFRKTLKDI